MKDLLLENQIKDSEEAFLLGNLMMDVRITLDIDASERLLGRYFNDFLKGYCYDTGFYSDLGDCITQYNLIETSASELRPDLIRLTVEGWLEQVEKAMVKEGLKTFNSHLGGTCSVAEKVAERVGANDLAAKAREYLAAIEKLPRKSEDENYSDYLESEQTRIQKKIAATEFRNYALGWAINLLPKPDPKQKKQPRSLEELAEELEQNKEKILKHKQKMAGATETDYSEKSYAKLSTSEEFRKHLFGRMTLPIMVYTGKTVDEAKNFMVLAYQAFCYLHDWGVNARHWEKNTKKYSAEVEDTST